MKLSMAFPHTKVEMCGLQHCSSAVGQQSDIWVSSGLYVSFVPAKFVCQVLRQANSKI